MRVIVALTVVALSLLAGRPAAAHAELERANPRVGATVAAAPPQLELFFTEPIEPAFSTVQVLGPNGQPVAGNKPTVDPADGKHLLLALPSLGAGTYKVVWRVVSVDTHVTNGDFTFRVAP
jgi:methionine-rich copper-binding protein CopC